LEQLAQQPWSEYEFKIQILARQFGFGAGVPGAGCGPRPFTCGARAVRRSGVAEAHGRHARRGASWPTKRAKASCPAPVVAPDQEALEVAAAASGNRLADTEKASK
jgi:hypothetical protein